MGISFFTSMGGVSGAFLLLPFQVSILGYTTPSVSATNQLFNIVAIPSGVYRYYKEGRMVWPLTWIVILGTLPGVLIGAVIRIRYLPDPKHFKIFAAAVLMYIGIKMIRELLKKGQDAQSRQQSEKRFQEMMRLHQQNMGGADAVAPVKLLRLDLRRLSYSFCDETFDVSTVGISLLSFIVGIIGGVYGIGGGAIIAPFFVSVFRLPVYTVAGAALMGTFVTSVAGVVFYQILAIMNPEQSIAPDWLLGFLFGIGGMIGMYLGARCQKRVPARLIKWMLAMIIVFIALKYVAEAQVMPFL
jgi:hypothetical protein